MRYKILLILFMVMLLIFSAGITYSIFYSNANLNSTDQGIAKFIFNTESSNELDFPLIDLSPGDSDQYEFAVSNTNLESISNVSVEYQMTLKTYHLVPLDIKLYRLVDEEEELILNCDETYTRNPQNELICNTPIQQMGFSSEALDNYILKIKFPEEYNDVTYSNLVDYLNIEIKSWQKLED